jgi:glycosyltransferase involved in cell wall biosynthesis
MKDISVVMAIYNEPLEYLTQCFESTIIALNDYDYEFIVVIDNPFLDCDALGYLNCLSLKNDRIILLQNPKNIGLALSLNRAIEQSNSRFIMRMDADDICYPNRVDKQIDFLIQNENVDLVGSSVMKIDENGIETGLMKAYLSTDLNKQSYANYYRSICFHPTWFARKNFFDKLNYHDLVCAQDIELLYRALSTKCCIRNVKEPLLYYRVNSNSLSLKKGFEQTMIRYFMNVTYADHIDYNKLKSRILVLNTKKYKFLRFLFERFSNRYYLALVKKKILTLILISLMSPVHAYKTYLLLKSKLND